MFDADPHAERSLVDDSGFPQPEFLRGLQVVDFDVPGVPVEGLVVVEDQTVCALVGGDEFPV